MVDDGLQSSNQAVFSMKQLIQHHLITIRFEKISMTLHSEIICDGLQASVSSGF